MSFPPEVVFNYVQCGTCGQKYRLDLGHVCPGPLRIVSRLEGLVEPGSTLYSLQCVIQDLAERVKAMEKSQAELAKSIHALIQGIKELL